MTRRVLSALALSALVITAGCSSSDSPTGPGGGGGPQGNFGMSATINGTAWTPSGTPAASISNNIFALAALSLSPPYSVSFVIGQVAGPGTYTLNYLNSSASSGIVTQSSKGWDTYAVGGTGSVTFTTLTSSHAVGTFVMTAQPATGGATGTITITNGAFDVTY
jgi:hypothetical protein